MPQRFLPYCITGIAVSGGRHHRKKRWAARGTHSRTLRFEQPNVRVMSHERLHNSPLVTHHFSRTPHAVAAVVAQVAVAGTHGDRAATVAHRGIDLEAGELLAATGHARLELELRRDAG